MVIFTWIVLGLAALLVAASGVCWALFLALDNRDWRILGVKIFRIGMLCVLLYINVAVYVHIVAGLWGGSPPTSQAKGQDG